MASSTSTSDMSFWIKFFKEAGIPAGDAANYAVVFSDNRISRAMLMDLNKEYLNDMGISILGDVISILKHAKTVFSQDTRDRALRDTSALGTPELRVSPILKRSTPASRTIAHHIGSERSASPSITPSPKLSKSLSARLGTPVSTAVITAPVKLRSAQKEEVPVPRKRRVFPEHEGPYKITMPQGTTARTQKILEQQRKKAELQRIKTEQEKSQGTFQLKTSVFSRLGSEKKKSSSPPSSSSSQPTITITGLSNIDIPSPTQSSVFARLGGKSTVKRAATSTSTLGDDDMEVDYSDWDPELEYAGVLKASPSKKPKMDAAMKVTFTEKKIPKVSRKPIPTHTDGFLSSRAKKEEKTIKSRLGPKSEEVSSTTATSLSSNKQGVQNRLGPKTSTGDFTITVETTQAASHTGIFKRLGKAKS